MLFFLQENYLYLPNMYARVDKALRRHPDPRRGDWSRAVGGPALPRRHALFYGPASRLRHPANLVKPSLASLAVIPARHHVIPAQAGISLLAPRVSSPRGHDRCRETLEEAA